MFGFIKRINLSVKLNIFHIISFIMLKVNFMCGSLIFKKGVLNIREHKKSIELVSINKQKHSLNECF